MVGRQANGSCGRASVGCGTAYAGPPLNAGRWSAWAIAAGQERALLAPYAVAVAEGRSARRVRSAGLRAPARAGRGRIELSIRPVLKHGPRSQTGMRAGGRQTH